MIANAAGQAVWRWDQQESFGNTPPDENPSGLGVFEFPLRLSNYYHDKETGMQYAMLRDCYDPATGRFCQSDPIGLAAGLNTYLYVDGSPLDGVDPLGLIKGTKKGRWTDCDDGDWAYCREVCGPRGVKSCKQFWQIHTEMIGGQVIRGWKKALYPSCNCNESCDAACQTVLIVGLGIAICVFQPQLTPLIVTGGAVVGAGAR